LRKGKYKTRDEEKEIKTRRKKIIKIKRKQKIMGKRKSKGKRG
jgi:hypothetical protein